MIEGKWKIDRSYKNICMLTQQLDKHWNNSEIHLRRFIWHLLRMM